MKIFNRSPEQKPAPDPAPAAAERPAEPATPPAPPAPDLTAVIDANVKEMSEKIARLASTVETQHAERSDFEAKIEKMEERMRKLSSLTEMISAQYNPFVGAAPTEREPMPAPEVGLATPPSALPFPPPPTSTPVEAPSSHDSAMPESPMSIALEDPFASIADTLDEPPAHYHEPGERVEAPPPLAASEEEDGDAPPSSDGAPARLWSVQPGFASSMLMLNWADTLLKSLPSREALPEVLEYYRNIGWIGDPARDQLLAYADGLSEREGDREGDWRSEIEVHERSLLFIEKLRVLSERRRAD